jgi:orotidine-5'-phosphate decarboxylase
MTPAEAIETGSSYLVIGRPITQAKEPMKALQNISTEIASV